MMKVFYFGVLLHIVVVSSTAWECNKTDIDGHIKLCVTDKGEQLKRHISHVNENTKCFVEKNSVIQEVACIANQWKQREGTSDIYEQENRRRRSWLGIPSWHTSCSFLIFDCHERKPPDTDPPDIRVCPIILHAIADPFQTYAKVTWSEPTAHDRKDGKVSVYRVGGRAPGRHFPESGAQFHYIAKDSSGNQAKCLITIHVKVVRCSPPTPLKNGYFICHPSTDFVRGGWCKFGCYDGFDLHGVRQITCQDDGIWSDKQPTCREWTCPEPNIIMDSIRPVCTNGNKYRSVCSYNCHDGFDMPRHVSKTIVCDINKKWRKYGSPKCIDIEAPVFGMCPVSKVFGTDRGVDTATVHWEEPHVTDNSNASIHVTATIKPGDKMKAGIYDVSYSARDDEENEAKKCTFQAIVRDRRCPKLYPTPFVRVNCPTGYRTGHSCNIECDPGKTIEGSTFVVCKESTKGLLGTWNWKDGHQTTCSVTNKCTIIQPPTNGAVVCDNWIGGKYCVIQCRNGTKMTGNWKRLFVCSTGGAWMPPLRLLHECNKQRHPRPNIGISASFYFYGVCTDKEAKEQIGENFVNALSSSLFANETCSSSIECSPDNVQISCGKTTRLRRDVNNTNDIDMLLTIDFDIPLVTVQHNSEHALNEKHVQSAINATEYVLQNTSASIFGSTKVMMASLKSHGINVRCSEGSVKVAHGLSCVECPPGTYYSRSTRDCISCFKGWFQNLSGQFICKQCPIGKTTRTHGSSSLNDCTGACEPGSFSTDGIVPCSPCEQGQYQPSYGQMKCITCHGSKTTLNVGSVDRSDCKEFDISFPVKGFKTATVQLREEKLLTDVLINLWFRWGAAEENINNNNQTGSINITFKYNNLSVFVLTNMQYIRWNDSLERLYDFDVNDNRWHNLRVEVNKCKTATFLDGIPLEKQQLRYCRPIHITGVEITADSSFSGGVSQLNIWNETNVETSPFRCFPKITKGIVSWQDFSDANLHDAFINIPSACDDFDSCKSSPCVHGNCSDALHGFQCQCNKGYTGKQCDHNIDDCVANVCMNNATCVDGVGEYSCLCPASFTGEFCEVKMVDGQWSEWTSWTECTTTCGPGEQFRKRLCNNPHPDNGGKACVGDATETVYCHNEPCPVCPELEAPGNGSIACYNETGNINCTISCDEGFDFDLIPLNSYFCGKDTAFEWNFQNEQNPFRILPKCTEIEMPEKIIGHFSVHYKDLVCSSDDINEVAKNAISSSVKRRVNNLPCIKSESCSLEVFEVTDCKKSKRQIRHTATAGILLKISTTNTDDANVTILDLDNAFRDLHSFAKDGEFTVDVLDDDYELDLDSSQVSGKAFCRSGTTFVNFYCVPCGQGSHAQEEYCTPCTIGTYQDEQGQRSCKVCPSGTTTLGIGSTNAQDCTVAVDMLTEGIKVTSIAVGCSCAVVGIVLAIFAYRRYRYNQKKKIVEPSNIDKSDFQTESYCPVNGLGPSKPIFMLAKVDD